MRKSLSIFFAALLVCAVHTGLWATYYCAVFSDVDSYDEEKIRFFAQTQSCNGGELRNIESELAYEMPFLIDCQGDGYRVVCVEHGTCKYFRSVNFCPETQCGMDQVLLDANELHSDEPNFFPIGQWIQNGLSQYHDVDINYDSHFSETDFTFCAPCDYNGSGTIDYSACQDDGSGSGRIKCPVTQIGTTMDGYGPYCLEKFSHWVYDCDDGYHKSDPSIETPTDDSSLQCVADACSGDGDCDDGLHCNTATGACISGCVTDVHCSGNTPICNTSNNTCVQCTGDDHCPDSGWVSNGNNRQSYTTNVCSNNSCTESGTKYKCDDGYHGMIGDTEWTPTATADSTSDSSLTCHQCTEHGHCTGDTPVCSNYTCVGGCTSDEHCSGSTPACDTATNACVGCINNDYCYGDTPICNTSEHKCIGCMDDGDCSYPTPKCKTDINQCVECLEATDCGTYERVVPSCTNNQCSCECDSNAWRFNSTNICNEIVCHDCPPKYGEISGELPGKTSGPGATDQSQCFITDNGSVPFEDKTGWYTINGKCDF